MKFDVGSKNFQAGFFLSGSQAQSGGGGDVTSVNGQTGAVVLTKTDIGIANVDNTSDLNKPISTATQTALDLKANTADVYTKTETYTQAEVNTAISTSKALPDSQIFVGNASNIATGVALSGDATISNTGVLTVNASSTPTANIITKWNADKNLFANNVIPSAQSINSGGTIGLTKASPYFTRISGTGTANTNIQLPDATTLTNGFSFNFSNASSSIVSVRKADNTEIFAIDVGTSLKVHLYDNTTTAGSWIIELGLSAYRELQLLYLGTNEYINRIVDGNEAVPTYIFEVSAINDIDGKTYKFPNWEVPIGIDDFNGNKLKIFVSALSPKAITMETQGSTTISYLDSENVLQTASSIELPIGTVTEFVYRKTDQNENIINRIEILN